MIKEKKFKPAVKRPVIWKRINSFIGIMIFLNLHERLGEICAKNFIRSKFV